MRKLLFFLTVFLTTSDSFSQDTLRYVDFHIHTSLKNYYRDIPVPDSIREEHFIKCHDISNWSGTKHRSRFLSKTGFCGFYGPKSYPEASWNMLNAGKLKSRILCTSISPLEKRFVSERNVHVLIFRPRIRLINKWFVTKLKMDRQKVIYEGSSFNELYSEYQYMLKQDAQNHDPTFGNVRLVKDRADLLQALQNNETGLVLTVEGGHSLLGKEAFYKNTFNPDEGINENNISSVYVNVDSLKKLPNHIFFFTLSHMTWNPFSPQAKSLDMKSKLVRWLLGNESKAQTFRHLLFEKFNNKIVDTIYRYDSKGRRKDSCICHDPITSRKKGYGWEIIRRLLDTSDGSHRILIDMRHMDVQARKAYMDSVNVWNQNGDHIPLIISHSAVNGKNYEQAKLTGCCPLADRYSEISHPVKFYKDYANCFTRLNIEPIDLKKTGWFHPWSINLFDEEIECVYLSDGIIGLTLEERILGTGRPNYNYDHCDSLRQFFKKYCPGRKDFRKLKTIEPFMRNLLYIVEHSGYKGQLKSWDHIAIGSDFDGIIDPIDECTSVDQLPHFYALLEKYLKPYAEFLGKDDLLVNTSVQTLLNKLFFENGERFVLTYYR